MLSNLQPERSTKDKIYGNVIGSLIFAIVILAGLFFVASFSTASEYNASVCHATGYDPDCTTHLKDF
jgi:Ca2+/Na+ antiporter